jgi:hypothetical protein
MKKIVLEISNKDIKTVRVGDKEITPAQTLVSAITSAVNNNAYTLEASRQWAKIGDKLHEAKNSDDKVVLLSEEELSFLQKMFKSGCEGTPQRPGLFKLQDKFWPDEVFRILEEAEEEETKKK